MTECLSDMTKYLSGSSSIGNGNAYKIYSTFKIYGKALGFT